MSRTELASFTTVACFVRLAKIKVSAVVDHASLHDSLHVSFHLVHALPVVEDFSELHREFFTDVCELCYFKRIDVLDRRVLYVLLAPTADFFQSFHSVPADPCHCVVDSAEVDLLVGYHRDLFHRSERISLLPKFRHLDGDRKRGKRGHIVRHFIKRAHGYFGQVHAIVGFRVEVPEALNSLALEIQRRRKLG